MRVSIASAAFAASLICANSLAATYIQAGKLIPANSNDVLSKVTVVIDDNKISQIKQGFVSGSEQDKDINLQEYTLMPGLMDMHTQLLYAMQSTKV